MTEPVDFVVQKLPYDLSSHGGLALVGRLFKRINLPAVIDPQYPVQTERGGIASSDIFKCYLALLTLGKTSETRAARRWSRSPLSSAPSHQDGDAGDDVQGRARDQSRQGLGAGHIGLRLELCGV